MRDQPATQTYFPPEPAPADAPTPPPVETLPSVDVEEAPTQPTIPVTPVPVPAPAPAPAPVPPAPEPDVEVPPAPPVDLPAPEPVPAPSPAPPAPAPADAPGPVAEPVDGLAAIDQAKQAAATSGTPVTEIAFDEPFVITAGSNAVDPYSGLTLRETAKALGKYLRSSTANWGTKNNRSPHVLSFEHAAGLRLTGVVGPEVRGALREHGVTIPVRPAIPHPDETQVQYQALLDGWTVQDVAAPAAAPPPPAADVPEVVPTPAPAPITQATESKPLHVCDAIPVPHLDIIFDRLAGIAAAHPDALIEKHFSYCRAGLLAYFKKESNFSWTAFNPKDPSFSTGPAQILGKNLAWLYSRRRLINPYADLMPAPPKLTGDVAVDKPKLLAILGKPDPGSLYIVAFLATFSELAAKNWDIALALRTDELQSKGASDAAAEVAAYVNAKKKQWPEVDPLAVLFVIYAGASSLTGMAAATRKEWLKGVMERWHNAYVSLMTPEAQGDPSSAVLSKSA
jgi:hypothetical protein